MPITRLPNGKLLYFAHVPKAAGTAVEEYLVTRFGRLGLLDRGFGRRSAAEAWTYGPPQHMPEAVRRDLLPDRLFDAMFATVRHPATRLRSAYLFARDHEGSVPKGVTFPVWVRGLPRTLATDPGAANGHVRPMVDIVPPRAAVFRIEDGLTPVVTWLDQRAGKADGPREIAPKNRIRDVLADRDMPVEEIALTGKICAEIAEIYAADYARFGYDAVPPA
ncbi:MAG: hypothetical protein AAGF60_06450 [Pseudomonadota bacterium]